MWKSVIAKEDIQIIVGAAGLLGFPPAMEQDYLVLKHTLFEEVITYHQQKDMEKYFENKYSQTGLIPTINDVLNYAINNCIIPHPMDEWV